MNPKITGFSQKSPEPGNTATALKKAGTPDKTSGTDNNGFSISSALSTIARGLQWTTDTPTKTEKKPAIHYQDNTPTIHYQVPSFFNEAPSPFQSGNSLSFRQTDLHNSRPPPEDDPLYHAIYFDLPKPYVVYFPGEVRNCRAISLLKSGKYKLENLTRPFTDSNGQLTSLLNMAVEWELPDVLTVMLDLDTTGKLDHTYTALDFAMGHFAEKSKITALLLSRLENTFEKTGMMPLDTKGQQIKEQTLCCAIKNGYFTIFSKLFKWGIKADSPAGCQALVVAIQCSLLTRVDPWHEPSMHIISKSTNAIAMANRLIKAGATIPETANPTKLLSDFLASGHVSANIIDALQSAGAKPDT